MVQLPNVAHERLSRPPLKAMLGQIRFPPVLALGERTYLAAFQDAVRDEYPDLTEQSQFGILVGPTGPVGPLSTAPEKRWKLSTADGRWSIGISQNSITLEASAAQYTDYGEFRARFEQIWPAAISHLRPQRRVQQGLRYVNHIEDDRPPSAWHELINPSLLGAVGSDVLGDQIENASSTYRLRIGDGTLVLKHGIVRAGPQRKRGYLLDFDHFTQQPGNTDVTDVLGTFDRFHDVIYPLFRWCITARALELFRVAGD
jgi:uncharacterized protein (TIGR04255 family)